MLFRLFFWLLGLIRPVVSRLTGWHFLPPPLEITQAVMVVAPHTSNWDFLTMLFYVVPAADRTYWLGKHVLFWGPFKWIMRWLHGIPVRRDISTNLVQQAAQEFDKHENLFLAITPEGTRKKRDYWKSGFYYIALQADVPLLLVYLDYARKEVGSGPVIHPSGDIEADIATMRQFYSGITGRHPEKTSDVRVVSKTSGE
jgi:1-acyl-sn-glycerol-3-phosphate acyltransferase